MSTELELNQGLEKYLQQGRKNLMLALLEGYQTGYETSLWRDISTVFCEKSQGTRPGGALD